MKNTFELSVVRLLVVVLFAGVLGAANTDGVIKLDDGEKSILSKLKMVIKVKGTSGLVDAHKNLQDTSKALFPHTLPIRDPQLTTEHHHLKKKVVDQLRSKFDNSVLKTVHGMAQQGNVRTIVDKSLDAKVEWAKQEGTQLKRFLALNAKAFEMELNQYFDKLSVGELYKLLCELKALIEVLPHIVPDSASTFSEFTAYLQKEQAIIANHSHPAPLAAPDIIE